MDNIILVTPKSVYGEIKFYPVNVQAIRFARLLGTKTLTAAALNDIAQMGFQIIEADQLGSKIRNFRLAA